MHAKDQEKVERCISSFHRHFVLEPGNHRIIHSPPVYSKLKAIIHIHKVNPITPHGICCKPHAYRRLLPLLHYHVYSSSPICRFRQHQTFVALLMQGTYLRGQVESKITATSQSVLNQQRNLVGEAELHGLGKTRSLAEIDEVFKGECQGDRFCEFDFDVHFWLVDVCVAS
jgi:hypothetical protein